MIRSTYADPNLCALFAIAASAIACSPSDDDRASVDPRCTEAACVDGGGIDMSFVAPDLGGEEDAYMGGPDEGPIPADSSMEPDAGATLDAGSLPPLECPGEPSGCGGDLAGTWTLVEACVATIDEGPLSPGSAGTYCEETTSIRTYTYPEMTWTFGASGNAMRERSFILDEVVFVPRACAPDSPCESFARFAPGPGSVCRDSSTRPDTCECQHPSRPSQGSSQTTYSFTLDDGRALVTTDMGSEFVIPYCVVGDTLEWGDFNTGALQRLERSR